MRKRLALVALLLLVAVLLPGCWSYRGLNNMAMVMGMSIDRDDATGLFHLSFEIADLANASKGGSMGSKLIESEGATIFDAVRNAKRKLINKLYFAHMEIVIFGEPLARDFGIQGAIDWCMRDAEVRETTCVLVSKGCDAHTILTTEGIDKTIISPEIQGIILKDNTVTSSTADMKLYETYSVLNGTGRSLTLPAFSVTINDAKPAVEADGVAIFNGDKLTGFLSAEETKYFLLAEGKAKGGILTLSLSGSGNEDTSLEISGTEASLSYRYENGAVTATLETNTDVFLAETMCDLDVLDAGQIDEIELQAGAKVSAEIADLLTKEQALYGDDILGIGAVIHARDFRLWRQLRGDWANLYPNITIVVTSKVNIQNTAIIKAERGTSQ